jgi:hypothetical protein
MADFLSAREGSETQRDKRRLEETLQRGELHDISGPEGPAEDENLPNQFAVWAPDGNSDRLARITALSHAVDTRAEGDDAAAIVDRAHTYLQFIQGTGGSGASSDPTD